MEENKLSAALSLASAVIEVERGNLKEETAAKLLHAVHFREYDINTVISFIREARVK